jgi:DNA (cytosine-5)-methyltransferase 1
MNRPTLAAFEVCAGAGGQAIGLELAGFDHAAAAEIDLFACATLRANRPSWNVIETDIRDLHGKDFRGLDLFAGGVPCPPFSVAGKQLGSDDERDLFPVALRLVEESKPPAVMLENVPGLATAKFSVYRRGVAERLTKMGYQVEWQVLNACNYGVPQLRPRFILVAIKSKWASKFEWPKPVCTPPTVGEALLDPYVGSRMEGCGRLGRAGEEHRPHACGRIEKAWRTRPGAYARPRRLAGTWRGRP